MAIARSARSVVYLIPVVCIALSSQGPTAQSANPEADADLERASDGRLVRLRHDGAVSAVPLEVYVARVLAGEAEPGALPAARQALAIAIRTFAVVNARRHRQEGFDLCDTTHCQVLRAANTASRQAATATAGRILTYRGVPAEVFYSASCGGRSESAADMWPAGAAYPYLQSVVDDVHDDDVLWTLTRDVDDIARALHAAGWTGRLEEIEIERRSGSGRVTQMRVSGLRPETVSGDRFRAVLGARELRSTAFSLTRRGRSFEFVGRGYGHGVGLCVVGAGRRARRGEAVEDILAHYYPGLVLADAGGRIGR